MTPGIWRALLAASDTEEPDSVDNNYLLRELEEQISVFVQNHNNKRLHESLNILTPADVYFGRGQGILEESEKIKKITIQNRCLRHRLKAA